MSEQQLEFNFPAWSQREDYIAELDFSFHLKGETYEKYRHKVKDLLLGSVLRHIGNFKGECYQKQSTIAERLKVKSVRSIQYAIAVLQALDVLVTHRPVERGPNHYRVNWEQVRRLVEMQRQHASTCVSALPAQCSQPASTFAPNPQVLSPQPASTCVPNPQVLAAVRGSEEVLGENKNKNPPPPNPPPASSQEEEGCGLVLIRTERPEQPAETLPLKIFEAPAVLDLRKPHEPAERLDAAALALRYRQANVWDADQLLDWLLPIVGGEYLQQLLEYWHANKAQWDGAGALRTRLKRSRPELAIQEGWPPGRPKPAAPTRRKTDQELAAERAAFVRDKADAKLVAASEPPLGEQIRARQRSALANGLHRAEACP